MKLFVGLFSSQPLLVSYLRVLAVTGGLGGGLVSGFIRNDRRLILCAYPLNGNTRQIECGTVADAVIGIGGAWGVFFVLGRSMRLGEGVEDLMTLIGLGVVAGFSARSLLSTLGDKVLGEARSVAQETAKETVRAQIYKTEDYSDIKDASMLVDISDTLASPEAKSDFLAKAEGVAVQLLSKDASNLQVLLLLGYIKKRQGLLPGVPTDGKNQLLDEAISFCSRAITLAPDREMSYYNRACYKALRGLSVTSVLEDVEKAIALLPENKGLFSTDPDLAAYKDKPEIAARLQQRRYQPPAVNLLRLRRIPRKFPKVREIGLPYTQAMNRRSMSVQLAAVVLVVVGLVSLAAPPPAQAMDPQLILALASAAGAIALIVGYLIVANGREKQRAASLEGIYACSGSEANGPMGCGGPAGREPVFLTAAPESPMAADGRVAAGPDSLQSLTHACPGGQSAGPMGCGGPMSFEPVDPRVSEPSSPAAVQGQ